MSAMSIVYMVQVDLRSMKFVYVYVANNGYYLVTNFELPKVSLITVGRLEED